MRNQRGITLVALVVTIADFISMINKFIGKK